MKVVLCLLASAAALYVLGAACALTFNVVRDPHSSVAAHQLLAPVWIITVALIGLALVNINRVLR